MAARGFPMSTARHHSAASENTPGTNAQKRSTGTKRAEAQPPLHCQARTEARKNAEEKRIVRLRILPQGGVPRFKGVALGAFLRESDKADDVAAQGVLLVALDAALQSRHAQRRGQHQCAKQRNDRAQPGLDGWHRFWFGMRRVAHLVHHGLASSNSSRMTVARKNRPTKSRHEIPRHR